MQWIEIHNLSYSFRLMFFSKSIQSWSYWIYSIVKEFVLETNNSATKPPLIESLLKGCFFSTKKKSNLKSQCLKIGLIGSFLFLCLCASFVLFIWFQSQREEDHSDYHRESMFREEIAPSISIDRSASGEANLETQRSFFVIPVFIRFIDGKKWKKNSSKTIDWWCWWSFFFSSLVPINRTNKNKQTNWLFDLIDFPLTVNNKKQFLNPLCLVSLPLYPSPYPSLVVVVVVDKEKRFRMK